MQDKDAAGAATKLLDHYDEQATLLAFARLVDIITSLRAPDGCPWDRKQSHASIARNAVAEAYEVQDAIERADLDALKEELGDLLLQVVLHAEMAAEAGEFTLEDVVGGLNEKLIRRHPHVFGTKAAFAGMDLDEEEKARVEQATTPDEVLALWDLVKIYEKRTKEQRIARLAAERGEEAGTRSLLDDVPRAEPALMQAQDISRKAIASGFAWKDRAEVVSQLRSELSELEAAQTDEEREEEAGDVLFTAVNLVRYEGVDAEQALKGTCEKFRRRWSIMEAHAAAEKTSLDQLPRERLEELWREAKDEIAAQGNL